jgi:hypothetical protein
MYPFRFQKLGWTNVVVVCSGAEEFQVPDADVKKEGRAFGE